MKQIIKTNFNQSLVCIIYTIIFLLKLFPTLMFIGLTVLLEKAS